MKISAIQNNVNFGNENFNKFVDKFQNNVRNNADMNDTIVVPRTIFKGYLGIMTGTTIVTAAAFINKVKHPILSKIAMLTGLATSMYGTWAFVRPFVVKDAPGVAQKK